MFEESLRENKNHFLNPRNVMVTVLLQPAAFVRPLSCSRHRAQRGRGTVTITVQITRDPKEHKKSYTKE